MFGALCVLYVFAKGEDSPKYFSNTMVGGISKHRSLSGLKPTFFYCGVGDSININLYSNVVGVGVRLGLDDSDITDHGATVEG